MGMGLPDCRTHDIAITVPDSEQNCGKGGTDPDPVQSIFIPTTDVAGLVC